MNMKRVWWEIIEDAKYGGRCSERAEQIGPHTGRMANGDPIILMHIDVCAAIPLIQLLYNAPFGRSTATCQRRFFRLHLENSEYLYKV